MDSNKGSVVCIAKSTLTKIKITGISILVFIIICLSMLGFYEINKRKMAVNAVKYMYTFNSIDQLYQVNMGKLEKLCTPEVFKQLTVQNAERALGTYLRFKGKAVEVIVKEVSSDYVVYELDTESLTKGRQFIFFYKSNIWGKLASVREAELYDFYNKLR